jgi:hypothetical protein
MHDLGTGMVMYVCMVVRAQRQRSKQIRPVQNSIEWMEEARKKERPHDPFQLR